MVIDERDSGTMLRLTLSNGDWIDAETLDALHVGAVTISGEAKRAGHTLLTARVEAGDDQHGFTTLVDGVKPYEARDAAEKALSRPHGWGRGWL